MTEGLWWLTRIHYNFFMKQSRFWYDHNLLEADGIIVNLASMMRRDNASQSKATN